MRARWLPVVAVAICTVQVWGQGVVSHNGLIDIGACEPQRQDCPDRLGWVDTTDLALGVAASGNHAYVASCWAGMRILELQEDSPPVEVGSLATPNCAYDVAAAGGYAYVAALTAGLRVIDVTDPSAPAEVGFLDDVYWTEALGVAAAGDHAYVNAAAYGLAIIDVSIPAAPVEVGACWDVQGDYGVAVAGSHVYVPNNDYLYVINVEDHSAPYLEGSCYGCGGSDVAVADGFAFDGHAYVSSHDGLLVVDVSDPSAPFQVGTYQTQGSAAGVAVSNPYAFVGDCGAGARAACLLRVIDVSTATAPFERAHQELTLDPTYAGAVAASGNFVTVVEYRHAPYGDGRAEVFDVSGCRGGIFSDDFEAGDTGAWSTTVP